MELAILAGVGLLGYQMSRGGTEHRPSEDERKAPLLRRNAYPAPAGLPGQREVDRFHAEASRKWRQSLAPHLTGVVTPETARDASAMMPFFRSMRSQNTNPTMNQRRMELYTGAVLADASATGTYRKKAEVAQAHPNNPSPITSEGTAGNPAEVRDRERYVVTNLHNNVSPVPQVRVGPGLGLGANDPATDGFHPMLRVLPPNVNAHRLNELPGAVNHGFSAVTSGARRRPVPKNRPEKPMALLCDRGLEQGRAAYTAPTVQSDHARPSLGRLTGGVYYGATGSATPAGAVHKLDEDRLKPDHYVSTPAMNLSGARDGQGAFVGTSYDPARFDAQQREAPGSWGFLTGEAQRRTAAAGHLLPPTQRDRTAWDPFAHGSLKPLTDGLQTRPGHAPQRTLRQGFGGEAPALNLAGGSATAMDNARRPEALDRNAKRAGQVVGHANGPGRMNVFEASTAGQVRGREDDNRACVGGHGVLASSQRHGQKPGELTSTYNKLPPANPRLQQLDVAQQQLASNPLALPPLSQR